MELKFCDTCYQMTNHLGDICLKHGNEPTLPANTQGADVMAEALKQIEQMSDCGDHATAVIRMKQIATKALSNK